MSIGLCCQTIAEFHDPESACDLIRKSQLHCSRSISLRASSRSVSGRAEFGPPRNPFGAFAWALAPRLNKTAFRK